MQTTLTSLSFLATLTTELLLTAATATAQVPDGYVMFGSFQGATGQNGIFFVHPRDTAAPAIEVTGLPAALSYDPLQTNRGVAALLRRPSDEAIIAAERAPAGTSVDVHVLHLNAAAVVSSQAFSIGTSVVEAESPQMGLLPDGRVVVAATDLTANSPLAQALTASFHWQGIGILDTQTGALTPIPITNLSQFPGVMNGLAVTPDGQSIYVTNWISTMAGDLWEVPIAGGIATQVASLPAPGSNLAVDLDGTVLVACLNGPPNLFRYDPVTQTTSAVVTTIGPLNAIAVERATGNHILATANAGNPARSVFWAEPGTPESLLITPDRATISALDVNPNPEAFGAGTPGAATYDWQLTPNPGGLPEPGNFQFSLTLEASLTSSDPVLFVMSLARTVPTTMFGMSVLVDLGVTYPVFSTLSNGTGRVDFPLPPGPALTGIAVYTQGFVYEQASGLLAASRGASFTIL